MRIALIVFQKPTANSQDISSNEDFELLNFLNGKGLDVSPEIWHDHSIDWKNYDVIILKSPWDYHEKIKEFTQWINKMDEYGIKFFNPVETIKWNFDKHYFKEIENENFQIVKSIFLEQNTVVDNFDEYFHQFKINKLIVKPCISASAWNTFVITKDNSKDYPQTINELLKEDSFIIQPFIEEILAGEWSFIYFNQKYSHSLLKIPKKGDFRVQHIHGGSIRFEEAPAYLIQSADKIVRYFAQNTLYARVDGVEKDNDFHLMELELIEPFLFLNRETNSFENYYHALMNLLKKL